MVPFDMFGMVSY